MGAAAWAPRGLDRDRPARRGLFLPAAAAFPRRLQLRRLRPPRGPARPRSLPPPADGGARRRGLRPRRLDRNDERLRPPLHPRHLPARLGPGRGRRLHPQGGLGGGGPGNRGPGRPPGRPPRRRSRPGRRLRRPQPPGPRPRGRRSPQRRPGGPGDDARRSRRPRGERDFGWRLAHGRDRHQGLSRSGSPLRSPRRRKPGADGPQT